MSREIRHVQDTRDLQSFQHYADSLLKDRQLRPRVLQAKRSGDYKDLGSLKRALIDAWLLEKNALAEHVVKDVEAQRREAGE